LVKKDFLEHFHHCVTHFFSVHKRLSLFIISPAFKAQIPPTQKQNWGEKNELSEETKKNKNNE
jgi:hypothetical protein